MADLLDRLLELGLGERTLGPDTLPAFATALRERADRVLAERVRELEERAAVLTKENAWRVDVAHTLEQRIQALEREGRWKDESLAAFRLEADALRAEWREAAAAHDRLLAHHRQLVSHLAAELEALPSDLPWGFRGVRDRLVALAAALRKELA